MTNHTLNNDRNRAVSLLQHYFELLALKSGIKWDNDNDVEIAEAVDAIIDAVRIEPNSKIPSKLAVPVDLHCDMEHDCPNPVTHLSEKGYVYCEFHGTTRGHRTRVLTPVELLILKNGQTIKRF